MDTLQEVINQIASDSADLNKLLRQELNKQSIHTLTLTHDQISLIDEAISHELGAVAETEGFTRKTDVSLVGLQKIGQTIQHSLESGDSLTLDNKKWSELEEYSKLINSRIAKKENQFELGHRDFSVMALRLSLLKRHYSFNRGTDISSKNADRQIALIDRAIAIAQSIDTDPTGKVNEIFKKANKKAIAASKDKWVRPSATRKDLQEVIKAAGASQTIDVTAVYDQTFNISSGTAKAKLVIELENTNKNQFKGSLAADLGKVFSKLFGDKFQKDILANIKTVSNAKASPSFNENLSKFFDGLFFDGYKGKKAKSFKQLSKKQKTKKIEALNSSNKLLRSKINKRLQGLNTKLIAIRNKKKFIIPTVTLKAIINQSLAEFIRLRMESSNVDSSINYLRNQTGNFSNSALLLTLNRTQTGAYSGIYTYQHEPYQIFEQGEAMGSPGRDPRLYIEGAAREIAQQVLKGQFKGLALESK